MTPFAKASLLAVLAAFVFNLEAAMVKSLEGVPIAVMLLSRSVGQLAWTLPSMVASRGTLLATRAVKLQLLRGGLSVLCWYLYFISFTSLPLATSTVLSFTQVLFVTALAGPVLREKVRWRRWTATLVGFAGVLVMLRPDVSAPALPIAAALGAAFLSAAIVLTTKALARTERTETIMFYIGVITTGCALPIALPVLEWPGWWNLALLLGAALCGPFGMHVWINALRMADASAVAPVSYVRLIFAAGAGVLLFGEVPDIWLAVGAALIIGSAVYITRREAQVATRRAAPLASAPPAASYPSANSDSVAPSRAASSPESR